MRILQLYFGVKHFFVRKIWMGLTLPKNALVLDVGSGDKPFWRANVFVDDLSISNSERSGNQAAQKFGVFVDANAESLPFLDDSFDFVYCSHLIEHVENPEKVLLEIMRVTKPGGGGYLECPSAIVEAIAPFPGHRWLIFETYKNELKFFRQSSEQHQAAIDSRKTRARLTGMFNWNGYSLFIQHFWRKDRGISFLINDFLSEEQRYRNLEAQTDYFCGRGSSVSHKGLVLFMRKLFKVDGAKERVDKLLFYLKSIKEYQYCAEENEAKVFLRVRAEKR